MRLTKQQKAALYELHKAHDPRSGFFGITVTALAKALDAPREGAVRTASSLVRRGLAVRFVSTLGRGERVHYQAEEGYALCPHGCGLLDWVDDSWICNACGDEWGDETITEADAVRVLNKAQYEHDLAEGTAGPDDPRAAL